MYKVRLSCLLQCHQRLNLPALLALGRSGVVCLRDLANEACEWQLANEKVRRTLILPNLTQCNCSRPAYCNGAASQQTKRQRSGTELRLRCACLKRCFFLAGPAAAAPAAAAPAAAAPAQAPGVDSARRRECSRQCGLIGSKAAGCTDGQLSCEHMAEAAATMAHLSLQLAADHPLGAFGEALRPALRSPRLGQPTRERAALRFAILVNLQPNLKPYTPATDALTCRPHGAVHFAGVFHIHDCFHGGGRPGR